MDLVTKAEARAQLRIDDYDSSGGADDLWLDIWIPAISDAVASWLKDAWRLYVPILDSSGDYVLDSSGDPESQLDGSGNPILRKQVKAAVLLELAWQYRFREGDGGEHTATGDLYSGRYGYILSKGATSILHGIRKATVA
jgi:hypothetical protein